MINGDDYLYCKHHMKLESVRTFDNDLSVVKTNIDLMVMVDHKIKKLVLNMMI